MSGSNERQENEIGESSVIDKVVAYSPLVAGLIVGRLFGFVGVGALVVGWLVYGRTKEKFGLLIAICAGGAVALATYSFAIIALSP